MKVFKFLSCFLFIIFFTNSIAQKSKTDSIAKTFSEKAWKLYYEQNDSSLYYANKGINYSKKNNSTYGEMINTEIKGIYLEEGMNNYELAAQNYFKTIEIAEKYHKDHLSSLYNNLCILYLNIKDYKKSIIYGKKALETSKKGTRNRKKALVNYGIVLSLSKEYQKATALFDEFFKIKNLNNFDKSYVYLRMAKNYKEQKLYNKAQPLLLKVIAYDSLIGKRVYNLEYAELIDNSIKLNDKKTIAKYLNVFKKSFKNEKQFERLQTYYQTMVNVHKTINNPKDALKFQDSLFKINDSLNIIRYKKGVTELETKYQTKKKEEQIVIEKNKRKIWTILSIFAVVILLIVVILLFKNNQKRKLLRQSKLDLEKALNQRNMLLKETHHRVKNSFQMVSSLLQLQAQGTKAQTAVKALDNAVQRVNSMIVLHQQLYAKDDLLGVNLKTYINDLINEIFTAYQSKNIKVSQNIDSIILNIDTATSIGLLVNELATNTIKYAWKKNNYEKLISINITTNNDHLDFKMFDNGELKKTKKTSQGYGSELIEILIDRLDAKPNETTENDFSMFLNIPIPKNEV